MSAMQIKLATFGTMWVGMGNWWQELDVTCYQFAEDESKRFGASGYHAADALEKDKITAHGASPQEAVEALLQAIVQRQQLSSPSVAPSPDAAP